MQNKLKFTLAYFLAYCVSGCNYIIFSLFLKDNPVFNIALYCGISSLILYSPIYRGLEALLLKTNTARQKITIGQLRQAFNNYGSGIMLSVIFSIGWQVITYAYLVNYDPILALLIVTFSRLLTPFVSAYLFGDTIGKKSWYWTGMIISLSGMFLYETGLKGNEPDNHINWVPYCILSMLNLLFLVGGSMIKRFMTSNPLTDNPPLQTRFLGVTYQKGYFLPVATRGFIVDLLSCLTLLAVAIINSSDHKLLLNSDVLTGVLWIGILGTIGFNLSLRLTNILSNVTTVVIDGIRPAATFFLFPLIIYIVTNKPFHLPLAVLPIFGYVIKGANVGGIVLCCCGALVSLRLGKPASRKLGHSPISENDASESGLTDLPSSRPNPDLQEVL